MFSLLLLGFLVGMRHAVESDHVAAVASLATGGRSVGHTLRQGVAWGIGHTVTLFLFGSLVLLLDTVIPERFAMGLELAVGVMLLGLGVDVLYRLYRDRLHFHLHHHADGVAHFHAHTHRPANPREPARHDPARHHHEHRPLIPLRALVVGLMHGMAGSAALILLALQSVESVAEGLAYIALFGLGSIFGMALLSLIIAIPLRYSARSLTGLHNLLHGTIGVATVVIGALLIHEVGIVGGLLTP